MIRLSVRDIWEVEEGFMDLRLGPLPHLRVPDTPENRAKLHAILAESKDPSTPLGCFIQEFRKGTEGEK